MNLQSFKGTPDSPKWRFKGSERKPWLGTPAAKRSGTLSPAQNSVRRTGYAGWKEEWSIWSNMLGFLNQNGRLNEF